MSHCRFGLLAVLLVMSSVAFGQCPVTTTASSPLPATAFVQNVAHITTGGGFVTKFTIVNLSASANPIVFNDINQDGSIKDTRACTVPANGTLRFSEGTATDPNETHWALVGSAAAVGVNLFFELTQSGTVVNTVGFNDVAGKSSVTFPAEFQTSPFHTLGLAISNPNSASNTITVALLDSNGSTLGTRSQTLPPFGQLAADLTLSTQSPLNIASLLPAGNFIGSVQVTGSSSFSVVGVGDDQGPFFSEAPMTSPVTTSSGSSIAASLVVNPGDAISTILPGTCNVADVSASGARSNMTVAVSPNADPNAAGFSDVMWSGWVKSNDTVTVQLCKFAKNNAILTAPLTFNVRVLSSSAPSSTGTVTVAAGNGIPTGTCLKAGANVAGASPTSAIVLSPTVDPNSVGWSGTIPLAYSDVPGHVVGEFCQFAGGSAPASSNINFNVAVLN